MEVPWFNQIRNSGKIKKLNTRFNNFLSSGIKGSLVNDDARKSTLITLFSFCAAFFFMFYIIRMYSLGEYQVVYLDIFLLVLIILMMLYMRRTKKIRMVSHILVFGLLCMEVFYLFRNGSTILNIKSYYIVPGIYWYYTFPMFSLFLLGKRAGNYYNIILIAITLAFFSINSPLTKLYDPEFKVRILAVYFVLYFFAYFFESVRDITFKAFERMQEKNKEINVKLVEANGNLKLNNQELTRLTEEVIIKNRQLEQQSREISDQRDLLLSQKKDITDSINYAGQIQKAMLSRTKTLEENLSGYFILYKPRDIIGGDFYFIRQKEEKLTVSVADCTGHGVPGALLSMLGISNLTEIVQSRDPLETGLILDELRHRIKSQLHQSEGDFDSKDGMDISLVTIDTTNKKLSFSGANNSAYIIRNDDLIELKADKMPIGVHVAEDSGFSSTKFELLSGDCIYLFSDGFADQFEEKTRKKFLRKNFRHLLLGISRMSMACQRDELERTIDKWKGRSEQTDDILVMGLCI